MLDRHNLIYQVELHNTYISQFFMSAGCLNWIYPFCSTIYSYMSTDITHLKLYVHRWYWNKITLSAGLIPRKTGWIWEIVCNQLAH